MKTVYDVSGCSSDGRTSYFLVKLPTHKAAIKFLDGRPNCVECSPTWSEDKMNYGGYTIRTSKVKKQEYNKLLKDWEDFQKVTKNLTERQLDIIARFAR